MQRVGVRNLKQLIHRLDNHKLKNSFSCYKGNNSLPQEETKENSV